MGGHDRESPGIAGVHGFARDYRWFVLGALLYAGMLVFAVYRAPDEALFPIVGPSLYLSPVFGLPYAFATAGRLLRIRRLIYFALTLPIAHAGANYAALAYAVRFYPVDDDPTLLNFTIGAIGGFTGAVLAFALLALTRVVPMRGALATMAFGTFALTLVGAAGMAGGLALASGGDVPERQPGAIAIWFVAVHLPWQLVFGTYLTSLMRPRAPIRD